MGNLFYYFGAAALGCIIHGAWHKRGNDRKLKLIIQKLNEMSAATDAIKEKLAAQSQALDTVSTNVTGIAGDVTFLKQKLSDLSNGATAAEIAELSGLVDGVSTKVDAIGAATASLDAETDPNAG